MNEELVTLDALKEVIEKAALNGVFLTAIYGLFHGEVCLYVGQSINPGRRFDSHRSRQFKGRPLKVKILDVLQTLDAKMAEGRWIKFYRDRGEAKYNKQCWVAFNKRDLANDYKPQGPKPFTPEEFRVRIAATLGLKR